jgi:hypothetical protein
MFGSKNTIRFNNYAGFWVNEKAFVGGAALTAVIAMTGAYLASSIFVQIEQIYAPLLAAIFTGAAFGHALGVSTEKEGKVVYSFMIGFFLAMTAVLISYFRLSLLSGIVLAMAVSVFLIHNSGLVVQDRRIDTAVDLFAGKFSVLGLIAIGLYYYILPIFTNLATFLLYEVNLIQYIHMI